MVQSETHTNIRRLNTVLRAIRNFNQLIVREKDRERLIQDACDCLVETRSYLSAWIGLVDPAGQVTATAHAGLGDAFAHVVEAWRRGELPLCAQSALSATGAHLFDVSAVCRGCPLADAHGSHTAIAARLEHDDTVYGMLAISFPHEIPVDEEEQALLAEVAQDLAFALHAIEQDAAHKRVEQALRASEARYRDLVQHSHDLICTHDLEGNLISVNPAATEISGYTEKELLAMNLRDLLVPQVRGLLEPYLTEIQTKGSASGLLLTQAKSGEKRLLEYHNSLRTEGVTDPIVRGMARDITDQRRAEAALQENRALLEQTVRALEERERFLSTLNDITRVALGTPDLPSMLQILADRLGELFDADGCYLTLWDERTQTVIPGAAYGESRETYRQIVPIPSEQTMTEAVLSVGHPLVARDVFDSPYISRRIAHLFPDRSLLGLPLIAGGRKLGAALVAFNKPHDFTAEQISRGEQTAEQISLAVAQALVLKESRARWQEAETLREAALALTSALDHDEVMDRILAQLQQVVPYDTASVQLLRQVEKQEMLEIIGGRGFTNWDEIIGITFDPNQEDNPNREVIRSRAPFVVDDGPAIYAGFRRVPHAQAGIRSWLGVPMLVGEQLIGMIALDKTVPGFYTHEHARLAEAFAAQAAIAIENARLYQALQDHAGQLERLVQERTAELQAQHAHLNAILGSVGDAILVTDQELRIRYINPAYTALTGYTPQEILGRSVASLDVTTDAGPAWSLIVPALAQGKMWLAEVTGPRKDGQRYDAALIVTPVHDAQGQTAGHVFSYRDVGQRKDLERARNQFITNVSHQFRTPVTMLKVTAHLMRQADLPEQQRRHLETIDAHLDWLIQLIQDTLDMTALDSGEGLAIRNPIVMSALIEDVSTRYQEPARAAGLTLVTLPTPPDLPVVEGDAPRLAQALFELVQNAITYTPAGGRVTVETRVVRESDTDWVTIAVQDTGPGIPPEEQAKLFERFYRGGLAEAGSIPGTGLGLSIAQKIALIHGGRLTFESETGVGSTFTLWLQSQPESD